MTNIAILTSTPRSQEGIVIRIIRGLIARFHARHEAAELRGLAALPPYLVADMGFPGFHLMSNKTRKAVYRAAIK